MKKPFSILIADRNPNMSDFLCRELSEQGYRVAVAGRGAQMLAEIEGDCRIDLLVFDLEMPGAEASKVFEITRRRKPPLPVVVHTFLTEESERNANPDKGQIYIQRSGNIERLKASIADMLGRFYPDR